MVGFQLNGQNYNKATYDTVIGAELLIYCGEEYATELQIYIVKFNYFTGKVRSQGQDPHKDFRDVKRVGDWGHDSRRRYRLSQT